MFRRARVLLAAVAVLAAAGLCGPSKLVATPHPSGAAKGRDLSAAYSLPYRVISAPSSANMEGTMLTYLNYSRAVAGRRALAWDGTLRTVARGHGAEMFAFGFLSHRSRDGRLPWDRITNAGIRSRYVGENLAYAASVRAAHDLLMGSMEHRSNILSTNYHRIGIGILDGGERGVIVVEDFTD